MKTVIFWGQKGGGGKTTCSFEFVSSLRRSGVPTTFYNLDGQSGTPLQTEEVQAAQIAVADCPGALSDNPGDFVKNADVVCIPVIPSGIDQAVLVDMLNIYKLNRQTDTRLVIIVNRFVPRNNSSREFLAWLKEYTSQDDAVITTLRQSDKIAAAAGRHVSVTEYAKRTPAAESAQEMVNAIRLACGLPEENID